MIRFVSFAILLLLTPEEQKVVDQISASGRCADLGERVDVRIAPGAPPLLSFRYYQGAAHHRFGNSELLLDDAGH